ncbi:MAG: hypothetical protein ACOC1G_08765, partial [Phycisphaeraceae bacterium]
RGSARLRQLQSLRPRDPRQLHRFVDAVLGLRMPRVPMEPGSDSPFDYLCHAHFERDADAVGDAVVWACRGGGKTMLGAAATLLDLLFKPGVQVRILGGSLEQSRKMYEHLRSLLDRPMLRGVLATEPTQRRILLQNGSAVELLAGSQRSVRGTRVHKLRCDEVEEFDPEVWEAAQLVTRSGFCNGEEVRGTVEAFSTMHRPFGLMSRIVAGEPNEVEGAEEAVGAAVAMGAAVANPASRRVFRWSAMDVAARCPPEIPCEGCVLWDDCGGRAKRAEGFVPIDDLMLQKRRVSVEQWDAEMMCRRPRRSDSVYARFDPERHASQCEPPRPSNEAEVIAGMDFGLRSPTVVLWALVWRDGNPAGPAVYVVAEHVQADATLADHIAAMRGIEQQHELPPPAWLGVDPAGGQRQSHSGLSDIDVLRKAGFTVRARRSKLTLGIEAVRRLIDHNLLTIHPRCVQLIRALQSYHFDPDRPASDEPIKDGPDHACDALRYLVVNAETTATVRVRGY